MAVAPEQEGAGPAKGQLKAIAYLKSMNGGGSQSQLVLGSNKNQYLVKMMGNAQGTRILANEYVVGKIAEILDAQVPPVSTIEIDADIIANMNRQVNNAHFVAGTQFAQLYIGESDVVSPSNPELMAKVSNMAKWPNSIVLDALTQNNDLKAVHILVEIAKEGKSSRYWHIDHGHCLGITAGWSTLSPSNATMRLLYGELVKGADPFRDVFGRMNALTREAIDDILERCPLGAWQVPESERESLAKYLDEAKSEVQNNIIKGKPTFPNWKQ